MTIEETRAQVLAENEKAKQGLAKWFVGRHCPLLKEECRGPECPFFLLSGEQQGNKVVYTSGNCAIPLIASQVGPIADALVQVVIAGQRGTDPGLPRVIPNGPVLR